LLVGTIEMITMKPFYFSIFLLSTIGVSAQERIDTDRPDQTESAFTVPKKYFQGEFGFGKENFEGNNYNLIYPTFLLKYGLSKRFELRVEGNFLSEYVQLIPNPKTTTGFEPVEIGTKVSLFEEKGILPKTSLIVHVGLPFAASNADKSQSLFPSFRFACQNSLTKNIGLGYNAGAEWNGYDNKPAWLYTFSPNLSIGKKWYAYVEAFGFYEQNLWQHNIDGGCAYYLSNDAKIDLSGGFGLGSSFLKNYFSLGFSFRLH
jgi:hypothetical protein